MIGTNSWAIRYCRSRRNGPEPDPVRTKQERVREHILRHGPATFRLADIRTAVPGVSDQTIRLVLEQLRGEGKARADGTGRSATWTRTGNTAPSE
jgi:hypothetical protein